MRTPGQLFVKRLSTEWKYTYGVWRTTIDWTVVLYIVLPALVLGISQYLSWWENPPFWLNTLSANLLFAACFLFTWSGTIRIFLEEADQLFLLKQKQWRKTLVRYGLFYSFFLYLIFTALFFFVLAPFILGYYQFSPMQMILLFVITFLTKVLLGLSRQIVSLHFYGWRRFIVVKGLLVLGSIVFLALIPPALHHPVISLLLILILVVAVSALSTKRLNYQGDFSVDMAREREEKFKHANLLLSFSGANIRKPRKQRTRPWLFHRSDIIFRKRNAVNGLLEAGIKAMLRNYRRLGQYFLLIFLCALIMMTLQGSIKWLVWPALAFFLVNFTGLCWQESMNSEFIKLFSWKTEEKYLALRKFLFMITLPGFLLISLPAGFQAFSWPGAVLIFPISAGLVFYICKIVAFYLVIISKE
ncbi:MAG: ABC transporter permease [Clostridia bacterium]|jgi:ABC-2 type transport system permease protein|nr:ABC transporter permease [Clostridia bacterium]